MFYVCFNYIPFFFFFYRFPVLFIKNPSATDGDGSVISVPRCAQDPLQVDYEGELGFIIGKDCRDATIQNALSYVLGFVVTNDVSARHWQIKQGGGQYCRGKSFDTFCPVVNCTISAISSLSYSDVAFVFSCRAQFWP